MNIKPLFLTIALPLTAIFDAQGDSIPSINFDDIEIETIAVRRVIPLDEVTVTGTRIYGDLKSNLPISVSTITPEQITESHSSSVLPVVAEQTPGLFLTQRGMIGYGVSTGGSGAMSIRGLGSGAGRVMVLIDGHPQYMGLMGHPIADAYQSQSIEFVEVLRGPASVLYGSNAMGGVVNMISSKNYIEGAHTNASLGYGSYNTLQSQLGIRQNKGNWSSAISGAYNRTDGHRDDMGFKQYAGYGKLEYKISSPWRIGADFNINKYNANNPGAENDRLKDAEQDITRGATSAWLSNYYYKTNGRVSAFYNWGNHIINDGYSANSGTPKDYRYHSRDYMGGLSAYQNVFFNDRKTSTTFGIDYFHFGGTAWNNYVAGDKIGTNVTLADKQVDEVAAYANVDQYLAKWASINAGVRYDYHNVVGGEWIPQAGLVFHLPASEGKTTLKAIASRGFRNPTLKELYMYKPANEDLESESIWSYELAFSQERYRLNYGANLFYITGDNLITTQMVNGQPLNMNTGEIENIGLELEGRYTINDHWDVNANYSYLHMENPVIASPEHKLYVGGRFCSKHWLIGTGLQYVGGLYTAVGDDAEQEDFVLWDLRVDYKVGKQFSIWAKGNNLLNQDYEINAGYPMPGANFMVGLKVDL